MKKFSEHIKTTVSKEDLHNIQNEVYEEKNLEELIDKYSKLSHEELYKEFLKESQYLKQRGGLGKNQIDEIERVLRPHLSEEQQNMFDNLMTEIK